MSRRSSPSSKPSRPTIVKYGDRQVKVYEKASGKWLLQWKEAGGWKNTTRASDKEAREAAREIAMRLDREPTQPALVTQEERRMITELEALGGWRFLDDAKAAKQILEERGASLSSAARFWVEKAPPAVFPITMGEAYERFLEDMRGRVKPVTMKSLESMVGRLVQVYAGVQVQEVTTSMLDDWMRALGREWSPLSLHTARLRILRFFRWCAHPKQGFLPPGETAADLLEKRKLPQPIPAVISPATFEEILGALEDKYVPYAAVCAFAGLRALSEAAALRWEHFDWDSRHIYVDLSVAGKTQRERFVPIEPNLARILLPYRKRTGLLADFGKGRPDQIFCKRVRRLGIVENWPSRILRHTYISSRIARGDPTGLVAEHAGNSESVSRKRYRRAMTKEQGESWFRIIRNSRENKVVTMT